MEHFLLRAPKHEHFQRRNYRGREAQRGCAGADLAERDDTAPGEPRDFETSGLWLTGAAATEHSNQQRARARSAGP